MEEKKECIYLTAHLSALETLTRKVALATSHQVISPASNSNLGPRYSIPFFQNISQTIIVAKEVVERMF